MSGKAIESKHNRLLLGRAIRIYLRNRCEVAKLPAAPDRRIAQLRRFDLAYSESTSGIKSLHSALRRLTLYLYPGVSGRRGPSHSRHCRARRMGTDASLGSSVVRGVG